MSSFFMSIVYSVYNMVSMLSHQRIFVMTMYLGNNITNHKEVAFLKSKCLEYERVACTAQHSMHSICRGQPPLYERDT